MTYITVIPTTSWSVLVVFPILRFGRHQRVPTATPTWRSGSTPAVRRVSRIWSSSRFGTLESHSSFITSPTIKLKLFNKSNPKSFPEPITLTNVLWNFPKSFSKPISLLMYYGIFPSHFLNLLAYWCIMEFSQVIF